MRLPSIVGDEQSPTCSQSLTFPAASLGEKRNHCGLPAVSKQATTPKSPWRSGLKLDEPLLVPTRTLPLAATGLPYDWVPSFAIHLTFFETVVGSIVPSSRTLPGSSAAGKPFWLDTMFREGSRPHMGQSSARAIPVNSIRRAAV